MLLTATNAAVSSTRSSTSAQLVARRLLHHALRSKQPRQLKERASVANPPATNTTSGLSIALRSQRTRPVHIAAPSYFTSRLVLTPPHIHPTLSLYPPYLLPYPHNHPSSGASALNRLWFHLARQDRPPQRLALGMNSVTCASQKSASSIRWGVGLTPHPLQRYRQPSPNSQPHDVARQSRMGSYVTRSWNRFGDSMAGKSLVRHFLL
jgi:hypothetical protein